jgi:hypothetical protein
MSDLVPSLDRCLQQAVNLVRGHREPTTVLSPERNIQVPFERGDRRSPDGQVEPEQPFEVPWRVEEHDSKHVRNVTAAMRGRARSAYGLPSPDADRAASDRSPRAHRRVAAPAADRRRRPRERPRRRLITTPSSRSDRSRDRDRRRDGPSHRSSWRRRVLAAGIDSRRHRARLRRRELEPMVDGSPKVADGKRSRRADQRVLAPVERLGVGLPRRGEHHRSRNRDLAAREPCAPLTCQGARGRAAPVGQPPPRRHPFMWTSHDVAERNPSAANARRASTSATVFARTDSSIRTARSISRR